MGDVIELPPGPARIALPGAYPDVDMADYVTDPVAGGSLSASGVKLLLDRSPAHFRQWADNPTASARHFDVGTAAHTLVLGTGPELVPVERQDVDPDDPRRHQWNTTAVKDEVKALRAAGCVPLHRADYDTVRAMAAVLAAHPTAAALLGQPGAAEVTLVWRDPETGVMRRCRPDFLPEQQPGRRLIIPDYKTCDSAHPDDCARAMWSHRYHRQGAGVLDAVDALGLAGDHTADGAAPPAFVLIFQEKTPPYVVTVAEPGPWEMRVARMQTARALRLYADCAASGVWPGYADEVVTLDAPRWAQYEHADAVERGDYG